MWVKQSMPCLPPMTGNGENTTYKNGDDWGMVYYCFTHMIDYTRIGVIDTAYTSDIGG